MVFGFVLAGVTTSFSREIDGVGCAEDGEKLS